MAEHGPVRGHASEPHAAGRAVRRRGRTALSAVSPDCHLGAGGRPASFRVQTRPVAQPVHHLSQVRTPGGRPVRPVPRRRSFVCPARSRPAGRADRGVLPRPGRFPLPVRQGRRAQTAMVPRYSQRVLTGLRKASLVFHNTLAVGEEIKRAGLVDSDRLVHAPLGVASEFSPDRTSHAETLPWLAEVGDRPWLLHVGSCSNASGSTCSSTWSRRFERPFRTCGW